MAKTKRKDIACDDPDLLMFSAKSVREVAKKVQDNKAPPDNQLLFQGEFITVPVLLALAMEFALKAWSTREKNNYTPTHDLEKLFKSLGQESQKQLEYAFPEILHPDFESLPKDLGFPPFRPGLKSLLKLHKDAFVKWRYSHEQHRGDFELGIFGEALDAVILAYEKQMLKPS